jgi:hypothetical protein
MTDQERFEAIENALHRIADRVGVDISLALPDPNKEEA